MFDQVRNYQAAYLGEFPTQSENSGPALTWASERAAERSCGLTVVAPTRRHFGDDPVLSALPPGVQQETPQTLGFYPSVQPVVVAFWPGEKDLEKPERSTGIEALVVVPWLEEDIDTWRIARRAVDLLGRHETPEEPAISDPVVEAAMRSLSLMVNLSTGLSHPRDRSMAIHAFRILKRNGHAYEPDEIHAWAMANGWAADDARDLSEYAAGVLAGKRYRAGSSAWRAQIIRQWRSQAQGD